MKDNLLKQLAKKLYFYPGAIRRIRVGPLRGMIFRVNGVTGLSPWYSGVERDHQRAFRKLVRAGDVVIDMGANWGLHTLYLSRLVGREGMVVAVEPFPPAVAELEWHIRANGCSNVKVLPVAISHADGDEAFVLGGSACTGKLLAVLSGSGNHESTISVTTRTLDSLVEELQIARLKLVKIDVEGAEGKVLLGSQRAVERHHPYFVIDLHGPEADVSVARLLTSWGYEICRLSGPPILRTDVGWPDPAGVWGSIVAAPLR